MVNFLPFKKKITYIFLSSILLYIKNLSKNSICSIFYSFNQLCYIVYDLLLHLNTFFLGF